ncbi:hypothetical protein [Nocardia xishanensis]|uniref:hypothetical protein n=1 Tax=Nocardia xishanensis TaxID=238964 RepID=UPI00082ED4BD|nr:hypothetical protein [Nocardia xishanensis]
MLPLAVLLGTGVANASPHNAAQAPATPPTTAERLSRHEQGQDSSPSPILLVLVAQSPVDTTSAADTGRVDGALAKAVADGRTGLVTVAGPDSPPLVDQRQIEEFCAQIPIDPRRCTVVAVEAGVGAASGAAIGAGIAAGVSAPVAVAAALAGAAAGFLVGIPFLPTGLVVGPLLGAAVGATVVAIPAALLGGALGASIGALVGFTTPLPQEGARTEGSEAPASSPN